METEHEVVVSLAERLTRRLVKKIRKGFQDMPAGLSGDDSGLADAWEEFCVQVQFQESFYWSAYLYTLDSLVTFYVEELKEYEQLAIWFQTDEGWGWSRATAEEREDFPGVSIEEVCQYIEAKVKEQADEWTSKSIEEYLGS